MSPDARSETLHASAVAVGSRGLLIKGASGSGKSSLALEMISRGATLIADDAVLGTVTASGILTLSAPPSISGLIEARGLGLIRLPVTTAPAFAALTLDETETDRLPQAHATVIAGVTLPLLRKVESPAFPAMLIAYLSGERTEP